MKILNCLKQRSNDYSVLEQTFSGQVHKSLYDNRLDFEPKLLGDLSVSIIIPYYNSAKTIAILLKSIQHQSFNNKDNLEVIIVDDGSTTHSREYLETLLSGFQFRITLVRHKTNLGRAVARNSGAYVARNDVFLFVDSDVILPKNFIFNHALKHKFSTPILLTSLKDRLKLTSQLTKSMDDFNFQADKNNDWRYCAKLSDKTISDIKDTHYFKDFGFNKQYFTKTLSEMAISTAISIRKEPFFAASGFCQDFVGWGREDVFLGTMAIATGCFIVPDLTTVYQIQRTSKNQEKEKKEQLATNKQKYYNLLEESLETVLLRNQAKFLDFHDRIESIRMFKLGKSKLPKTSVIIPLNNDSRIKKCLQSLKYQSLDKTNYEIIVVENGPEKKFENICAEFGVRYYHLEQKSIPKARNKGIKMSKSKTILFTDADCVLPYFWLEEMLTKLQTERIVGGPIRNFVTDKNIISRHGHTPGHGQTKPNYLPIVNLPYVVGANAGFYREDLINIGLFDEELLSGNDVDMCYRLGLKGLKPIIASKAMIWHEDRTTLKKYFHRFYNYATYHTKLFKKYQPISGKRLFVNHYPTKKIFGGLLGIGFGLIQNRKDKTLLAFLNFIEGAGLALGYFRSMITEGVLYIP